MGKGRKQGADKPALVGPRGPVSGGGGGATSRREAALPKNEVPTSRLKTHPSALEHGKEWRNILLLRPKKRAFARQAFWSEEKNITTRTREGSRRVHKVHPTDFPVHSVQGPLRGGWFS